MLPRRAHFCESVFWCCLWLHIYRGIVLVEDGEAVVRLDNATIDL